MKINASTTRRQFITRASTAVAAFTIVPRHVLGGPRHVPPSEKVTIKRSRGHHREWLDACKGGPAPVSNFESGARLTEIGLLGLLAVRAGKPIEWETEKMQVKGMPALERIIRETYRKGWEVV